MRTYPPQSILLSLTPYPLSKGEGRDMLQDTDGEPMMEKLKNPQSILLPLSFGEGLGVRLYLIRVGVRLQGRYSFISTSTMRSAVRPSHLSGIPDCFHCPAAILPTASSSFSASSPTSTLVPIFTVSICSV